MDAVLSIINAMRDQLMTAVNDLLGEARLPGEVVNRAVPAQTVGQARTAAREVGVLGRLLFAGQGERSTALNCTYRSTPSLR
jgi:hypothetical protein